jgi:hypothetical protein
VLSSNKKNKKIMNNSLLAKAYSNLRFYSTLKEDLLKGQIDLSRVTKVHSDETKGFDYKFGKKINYFPEFNLNDFNKIKSDSNIKNWRYSLHWLIENKFKEGVVYSIAVLGLTYVEGSPQFSTFGPHLLVTKDIKINNLIIYIEGQIESSVFNLESPKFFDGVEDRLLDDVIVLFRYRDITNKKEVYDEVKETDYTKKTKGEKVDLNRIKESFLNKSILKKLPQSTNYGYLLNKNYTMDGLFGELYLYSDELKIFKYNNNKFIVLKNNVEHLRFEDEIGDNGLLIRTVGNNKIYIKDGSQEPLYMETTLQSRKIGKGKRSLKYDDKFITFDIECYLGDKKTNTENSKEIFKFIPYACAWYGGKESRNYVINDYNNWEGLLITLLDYIEKKYKNYTIYVHNLKSFDSIFIIKTLVKRYKTKVLFKDGGLLSIRLSSKRTINFNFKDSLAMLPLALSKLNSSFNTGVEHILFPYKFVSEDKLNYKGELPLFEDFDPTLKNLEKYKKYETLVEEFKDKDWDLIEETKRYVNSDVESLYKVIDKWSKEIYEMEHLNITDVVSISSLALKIFLTNYYDPYKTPIHTMRHKQYKEIKEGYYGGRVEIFKNYGENLYYYDVNSLYSQVMLQDMPIGSATLSTDPDLNNYFGFCYVTVKVPGNTYNPILPYRDDDGNVFNPTGEWSGMYSSELLKLAIEVNNVDITVHYGYKFERGVSVFKDFVEHYYNIKLESKHNEVRRLLAKLMLNSLYGRFGLKHELTKTEFVDRTKYLSLSLKHDILENIIIDDDLELVKYSYKPSDVITNLHKFRSYSEEEFITRSIPIAATITAYAMCYMYPFLNMKDNPVYYTDTDSIILGKPLDPKFVGDGLGKFKLVGEIVRGYFITPKLYCVVLEDGRTIIKSKGVDSSTLTEQDFIDMLHGSNITVKDNYRFSKDFVKMSVNYRNTDVVFSAFNNKREPLYNASIVTDTKPLQVINNELIRVAKQPMVAKRLILRPNFNILVYVNAPSLILRPNFYILPYVKSNTRFTLCKTNTVSNLQSKFNILIYAYFFICLIIIIILKLYLTWKITRS